MIYIVSSFKLYQYCYPSSIIFYSTEHWITNKQMHLLMVTDNHHMSTIKWDKDALLSLWQVLKPCAWVYWLSLHPERKYDSGNHRRYCGRNNKLRCREVAQLYHLVVTAAVSRLSKKMPVNNKNVNGNTPLTSLVSTADLFIFPTKVTSACLPSYM